MPPKVTVGMFGHAPDFVAGVSPAMPPRWADFPGFGFSCLNMFEIMCDSVIPDRYPAKIRRFHPNK
jgi:hypothetical protein